MPETEDVYTSCLAQVGKVQSMTHGGVRVYLELDDKQAEAAIALMRVSNKSRIFMVAFVPYISKPMGRSGTEAIREEQGKRPKRLMDMDFEDYPA